MTGPALISENCLRARRVCGTYPKPVLIAQSGVPKSPAYAPAVSGERKGTVNFQCLPDPRIGNIEIVFPRQTIAGFLPVGCDDIAIIPEFPFKSL